MGRLEHIPVNSVGSSRLSGKPFSLSTWWKSKNINNQNNETALVVGKGGSNMVDLTFLSVRYRLNRITLNGEFEYLNVSNAPEARIFFTHYK